MKVIILIIPIVVLICIQLIPIGYGTDIDNYRVMLSSKTLIKEGRYIPSRNFGYPLNEIIMSPLYALGKNIATNTATLILFILSIFIFYKLAMSFKADYPEVITIIYAFHPILLKNATIPLDYIWSLAFVMSSLITAGERKPVISGMALAIAVGFRAGNILYLPILLIVQKNTRERIITIISTLVLSLVLYSLPISYFINKPLNLAMGGERSITLMFRNALGLFGNIGWLMVIVLAILWLIKQLRSRPADRRVMRGNIALTALIAINIAIFVTFPFETEYLITLLPAFLILISQRAPRPLLALLAIAVISYNFVWFDITSTGIKAREGVIISQIEGRKHLERLRSELPEAKIPEPAIIVCALGEALYFDNPDMKVVSLAQEGIYDKTLIKARGRDVFFVYIGDENYISRMVERGYHIYYLPYAREMTLITYGYDIYEYGDELNI
ncbi:MAG: hypothetical protein DRH51_08055 [Candidatus Coatesbacteria bacterium]|nr:MAG: hypothetical protein DRH51_08055 [Candidatus Coatesbacteria bacterium]RLC42481.1 MAG: hypothetical protein DRH44_06310 [Candidatus Coatesbacteria bacterium]